MPSRSQTTTEPSVSAALALLGVGNAEKAAEMLRGLLRDNSADAEAWHGMACVARAGGENQSAVGLAGRAIQISPEPHFHITLGLALLALGHQEAARAAVHVAVLGTPRDPRAHQAMAEVLEAQGRVDDAGQALRNALRLRPLEAVRHLELAAFLARHGQTGEAVSVSEKAVALAPQDTFTQNQHALLLERTGRMAEAEPYFATVAAALPHDAAALANYGAALFSTGAFETARSVLEEAIALRPDSAETRGNLGLVLMALGALPKAAEELKAAHKLRPEDVRLAVNYGTVLADLGRRDEAEELFRNGMASATSEQDRARAVFNLGTLLLGEGRFHEGWLRFEARKLILPAGRTENLPSWDGQPQHAPVLIYAEQGLGDTLQFLRYVLPAAARAPVILAVPDGLQTLVAATAYGQHPKVTVLPVRAKAQDLGAIAACSLLSLPHVLGLDAPLPWQNVCDPTIWADTDTQSDDETLLQVGLCWSGNPNYRFDRRRSLTPDVLAPLAHIEGVSFQSLQKQGALPDFPVMPLPEGDMLVTARVIAGLDVVITVDTVIAHLAGMMGKPVWLLNRFGGDWRWEEGSSRRDAEGDSHNLWYPSLRVFTQPEPGEGAAPWAEPVEAVKHALRALVRESAGRRLLRQKTPL
ncbi:tetratricopeptide repeat protein [Acetobacter senegalensis]|uniref:tetratricopeptide repeat protein n=1 Tax=Acetobacter senegalensis TaxID=446692 RepID=UPI00209F6EB3|nr:tetratricopeptide repeat protein [Acetobacter senegalensis]MCP1195238.1 tetratricopeptide repeat protein [Acetobacter senegalensis]